MNDIPLSSLPRKSFALPMPHLHEPSPCARHCFAHAQAIALRMRAPLPELRFVATVTTGGRVKFVPAVYIFLEINAMPRIICIELQDLHTPSVILHRLHVYFSKAHP